MRAQNAEGRATFGRSAWWHRLGILASALVFLLALWTLDHALKAVRLDAVLAEFSALPGSAVALAILFTALSYFTLSLYDLLAVRYIGHSVSYLRAALASFASYTVSHNLGLSLVTGGSMRFRIYSAAGLSAPEIASVIAICTLTFGLGMCLVAGTALVLEPGLIAALSGLPAVVPRAFGGALLALIAVYLCWTGSRAEPVRFLSWSFRLPSLPVSAAQFALAVVDLGCAAAALYVLLPTTAGVSFPAFIGLYVLGLSAGIISHVPGGLGVFESVLLLGLPSVPPEGLVGAMLAYRLIYYLGPLGLTVGFLGVHELAHRREALQRMGETADLWLERITPHLVGTAVFAGGVVLLLSGATPALDARMAVLRQLLPLPLLELSHLLASVVGLGLMILSRGLFRRLDAAYHFAALLLGTGIALSLLKGFDYEEALILGVLLALLGISRRAFYRRASLLELRFSAAWLVTIAIGVAASFWLGLFAYKHVEYANVLWWKFAYQADASRSLRASVVVAVLTIGFAATRLLRPVRPPTARADPIPARVEALVAQSPHTAANLALTGDKRFLLAEVGLGFIMYRVQGRSWIMMGDPIGDPGAWAGLLWRFRETCDRYDGWPVAYQVSAERLPLYLDIGLSLLKIGEEARVDLAAFSLDGSRRRDLRYAERRAGREGATFEVVRAADLPSALPDLRRVSDSWLGEHTTGEKGFSVGRYSEAYLSRFDCALVRRGSEVVAFANIWSGAGRNEVSVDLMRHVADAPRGIMDFLFARLMLWGRDQGYRWFNLGMAPLSGFEEHPLAPTWHRVGGFVFQHGEHFYGFQGLREYKEKFGPVWEPKYLACPGGLAMPRILLDVSAAIAGGATRILRA